MPALLIVAEGEGEVEAAPKLVSRLLRARGHEGWFVRGGAYKTGGLPTFLSRPQATLAAVQRKNPDAVLFLFDLDDGCPLAEAPKVTAILKASTLPFPTAVVLVRCEYEAWMIASIESIAASDARFPAGLVCDVDPETIRDAKGWLTARLPAGTRYKPTIDQTRLTSAIDLAVVAERSRSFRRLCHALDELVIGTAGGVTP